MDDYIVEMRHVTKRFPGIVANDDISLGIKKGEIFALLGENGAGKSTLMSILFGMYEPDEGEVYIRGKKVETFSPNHATALSIGMVHQHFKLVSDYTITENIILGMEPRRRLGGILPVVDVKSADKKVAELSRKFGLEVDPTQKIEDLNVSMQQRVEILKMLYREAEILIFDEPTAVLTPQEIEFLLEIIREMRRKGKTIILITHKLEEIKKVADRCAILCRGKLVDVCSVADTSTKEMAARMVGREVSFELEKEPAKFGKPVLQVENLTVKNDDGFTVVNDVSFSVRQGEIFAIAGVAGNGQVEIADAVAGLLPAAGGTIKLAGQDITRASVRARSVKRYTASSSSAKMSNRAALRRMRPLWSREKSKSSSTRPERRSDSRMMTVMPFSAVTGSAPTRRVSAQPLMAVRGVRSSWETEEMKSFFMRSAAPSSPAMSLTASHSWPSSSSLDFSTRTSKSPWAICLALALMRLTGTRMERMKYTPLKVSSSRMNNPASTRMMTTKAICWSARSRETT